MRFDSFRRRLHIHCALCNAGHERTYAAMNEGKRRSCEEFHGVCVVMVIGDVDSGSVMAE